MNHKESVNILKAWHLVEFFQAYSVPDKENSKITPVNVSFHELVSCKDKLLPWITPECRASLGLTAGKKCTYTLYLGLFDKAVIDKKVAEYFSTETGEAVEKEEIEQRRDNEGMSCFAKLMLDEFGSPRLDTFSVSTLPWALAELLAGRGKEISQARFDDHCDKLSELLERWITKLSKHPAIEGKGVVCAANIMSLVEGLYKWAGLVTSDLKLTESSTVYLYQMACDESEANSSDQIEDKTGQSPKQTEHEDEEELTSDDSQLPILNSFYIRDIEKGINAIASGNAGKALTTYLQGSGSKHVDLYTNPAMQLLHERLAPSETPEGRWLAEPEHNMSLMQQFAINTAFKELDNSGLLSVNGPPGTGKTTLLRDIIAQNVVERAKVLASLNKARDGLTNDGFLKQALTGYEMVVASSNNAAVENISRELPQSRSVGQHYSHIRYFLPVANQVNAEEKKEKLQPLTVDNMMWGNISAVMGSYRKRDKFLQRFFFKPYYPKGNVPALRDPSVDFLNFWQYRENYTGLSFTDAKNHFKETLSCFNQFNDELNDFYHLEKDFSKQGYEVFINKLKKELTELTQEQTSVATSIEQAKKKQALDIRREEEITLSLQYLNVNVPGFFSRLFNLKSNRLYKASLSQKLKQSEQAKQRIRLLQGDIYSLEQSAQNMHKKVNQKQVDLQAKEQEYNAIQSQLTHYRKKFKGYHLPADADDIDNSERQRHACWQNEHINRLRSDVYAAALQLHEAWLIEVSHKQNFLTQVCKIRDVVLGRSSEDALAVWQILFMFVPVISTTFASMGNMFSTLSPESLGWLMIDEAGQAIPQAAVGGLLRAKRAIVVGDPLQIEPVFTSPPQLVNYLMNSKLPADSDKWNPCKWSVQTLSDRVNPYGCMLEVEGEDKWIGIPLWVHRRCIEPMFSIANEIAYNNRMIHGLAKENIQASPHSELGINRWKESKGECVVKQYTHELGIDVLTILTEIADKGGDVNKVYVISPFKAVKNELKDSLRQNSYRLLQALGWGKKEFSGFLKNNIGTVHTFQGKENDTVILVLGCDTKNNGGALWASSKPNLLNVAVTRAKKHLFVVGDSQVWADKGYFDKTYSTLIKSEINKVVQESEKEVAEGGTY